jgi:hypothetical protein
MAPPKILQEGQSYTFRSYFELPYEADDILAEFGYSLTNERLTLPHSELRIYRSINQLPDDLSELIAIFVGIVTDDAPS